VIQPTAAPPQARAVQPTAPAGLQRISFAAGATSGGVDGAVVRGTEQRYVLGARAGQLMRVQVGAQKFTSIEGRSYVAVRGVNPGVGGQPLLESIVYVDMDGDGVDEAAITLNSGGTAGNIGFLIYRQARAAPQLAAWHDGYKLGLAIEAGQLVARNALYAGREPNCCPSGFSFDTYILQGQQLQLIAHRAEGITGVQAATVERFYELLGQKDFMGAYALLADTERAANPYDPWAAGYADTLAIQATVTAEPALPNTVRVELTATDRTSDGGQVLRHFAGTWQLVWAGAGRGWALIHPNIGATQ
jgi:hypothetical protein